jgi:hypothetical protein
VNRVAELPAPTGVGCSVLLGVMVALLVICLFNAGQNIIHSARFVALMISLQIRYFFRMSFLVMCSLLEEGCSYLSRLPLRLLLRCLDLIAYKLDMSTHFRRISPVKNKLINPVQMFAKFHGLRESSAEKLPSDLFCASIVINRAVGIWRRYSYIAWLYWEFVRLTIIFYLYSNSRKLAANILEWLASFFEFLAFVEDRFSNVFKVHRTGDGAMTPNVKS